MRPFSSRFEAVLELPRRRRRRAAGRLATLLVVSGVLLLAYAAWPYVTLWRIDRAVRGGDLTTLAGHVDLESVQSEIKRRLNKDVDSSIGELSDSFIRWLEAAIGARGNQAVEELVTLPWVQERLEGPDDAGAGLLGRVTYAFFEAPDRFVARIGPASADPIWLRLALRRLDWRICALYY